MGFGLTVASDRALNAVKAAFGANDPSGNVITIGDRRYFFEVRRKDQPDGGVRGSVHLFTDAQGHPSMAEDSGFARRVGYFNVHGSGRIVRWPGIPQAWIREWNQKQKGVRL